MTTPVPRTLHFCPLCHGEMTWSFDWSKAPGVAFTTFIYTERHTKDCPNVPSERELRARAGVLQVQPGIPGHCPEPLETLRDQRLDIERDP